MRTICLWLFFWPVLLFVYFLQLLSWSLGIEKEKVYPAHLEDELADDIFTFHRFNQREYVDPVNGGIKEREIDPDAPEFWM